MCSWKVLNPDKSLLGDKSCTLMGSPLLSLHRALHRREPCMTARLCCQLEISKVLGHSKLTEENKTRHFLNVVLLKPAAAYRHLLVHFQSRKLCTLLLLNTIFWLVHMASIDPSLLCNQSPCPVANRRFSPTFPYISWTYDLSPFHLISDFCFCFCTVSLKHGSTQL